MNAEPSLEFDVMRTTDLVGGPFTPPGFYYKTFIRPRRFWPLYEKFLRHAAGLGKLRKSQPEREWRTEYRRRHADVLVIGGGAAGLSAAAEAAELGADVVLADEGPEPGGRLLAEGGVAYARELAERARTSGRRDPRERARARHLRRPRAGLAGRHAPPDPRAAHSLRHRRDRAAAALPRQRPAGRDAVRRRPPADRRCTRCSRARARWWRRSTTAGCTPRSRCIDAGVEICCVADLRDRVSGGPAAALERMNVRPDARHRPCSRRAAATTCRAW